MTKGRELGSSGAPRRDPTPSEGSGGWLDQLGVLLAVLTLLIMVLLVIIIALMVLLGA